MNDKEKLLVISSMVSEFNLKELGFTKEDESQLEKIANKLFNIKDRSFEEVEKELMPIVKNLSQKFYAELKESVGV